MNDETSNELSSSHEFPSANTLSSPDGFKIYKLQKGSTAVFESSRNTEILKKVKSKEKIPTVKAACLKGQKKVI